MKFYLRPVLVSADLVVTLGWWVSRFSLFLGASCQISCLGPLQAAEPVNLQGRLQIIPLPLDVVPTLNRLLIER